MNPHRFIRRAPMLVFLLGAPACDRPAHDAPVPATSTTAGGERVAAQPQPWEAIDSSFAGCEGA